MMPTGGGGTGRNGAIDVPMGRMLAKHLLFPDIPNVGTPKGSPEGRDWERRGGKAT